MITKSFNYSRDHVSIIPTTLCEVPVNSQQEFIIRALKANKERHRNEDSGYVQRHSTFAYNVILTHILLLLVRKMSI